MSARAWLVLAVVGWWLLSAGGGVPAIPPATAAGERAGGGAGPVSGVPYAELFNQAGTAHGVDPALLAAVASVESDYQPGVTSGKGAQGLMQFMPPTATAMGVDPWDPSSAVDGAARYLANSYRIHGNWPEAVAAYNAVTRRGAAAADGSYVDDVMGEWRRHQ